MKYIIGFRSGRVIKITTQASVNFPKLLADGMKDVAQNWFRDKDILIQVSAIEFAIPDSAVEVVK